MEVKKKCRALHQERVSDRLEGQRQEQAVQLYHDQADELDQWLIRVRPAVSTILERQSPPEEAATEDQLAECQVRAPPAVLSEHCMWICLFGLLSK